MRTILLYIFCLHDNRKVSPCGLSPAPFRGPTPQKMEKVPRKSEKGPAKMAKGLPKIEKRGNENGYGNPENG